MRSTASGLDFAEKHCGECLHRAAVAMTVVSRRRASTLLSPRRAHGDAGLTLTMIVRARPGEALPSTDVRSRIGDGTPGAVAGIHSQIARCNCCGVSSAHGLSCDSREHRPGDAPSTRSARSPSDSRRSVDGCVTHAAPARSSVFWPPQASSAAAAPQPQIEASTIPAARSARRLPVSGQADQRRWAAPAHDRASPARALPPAPGERPIALIPYPSPCTACTSCTSCPFLRSSRLAAGALGDYHRRECSYLRVPSLHAAQRGTRGPASRARGRLPSGGPRGTFRTLASSPCLFPSASFLFRISSSSRMSSSIQPHGHIAAGQHDPAAMA